MTKSNSLPDTLSRLMQRATTLANRELRHDMRGDWDVEHDRTVAASNCHMCGAELLVDLSTDELIGGQALAMSCADFRRITANIQEQRVYTLFVDAESKATVDSSAYDFDTLQDALEAFQANVAAGDSVLLMRYEQVICRYAQEDK